MNHDKLTILNSNLCNEVAAITVFHALHCFHQEIAVINIFNTKFEKTN